MAGVALDVAAERLKGAETLTEAVEGGESDQSEPSYSGRFARKNLTGMFNFEGGGQTPDIPRVGGLDGKGGFPVIMHGNETVIDHTKGQQTASAPTVNNTYVTIQVKQKQTGPEIEKIIQRINVQNRRKPGG